MCAVSYFELQHGSGFADSSCAQLSWKVPRAPTHWDDSVTPVSSQSEFELYSSKSKRPPTEPSQPASKLCRQSKDEPGCGDAFQWDLFSSPALRAGLAARREMVQKLRKQIRSRDGILFDLQVVFCMNVFTSSLFLMFIRFLLVIPITNPHAVFRINQPMHTRLVQS